MALLAWLILVGRCQHLDDPLERHEIAFFDGGLDHFFHPMIARNEGWIHGAHLRTALCMRSLLAGETLSPTRGPVIERGRILEQRAHTLRCLRALIDDIAQTAKGQREIRAVVRHPGQ